MPSLISRRLPNAPGLQLPFFFLSPRGPPSVRRSRTDHSQLLPKLSLIGVVQRGQASKCPFINSSASQPGKPSAAWPAKFLILVAPSLRQLRPPKPPFTPSLLLRAFYPSAKYYSVCCSFHFSYFTVRKPAIAGAFPISSFAQLFTRKLSEHLLFCVCACLSLFHTGLHNVYCPLLLGCLEKRATPKTCDCFHTTSTVNFHN